MEITEVIGRADAGFSARPFRCRGEDDQIYYVKLGNALAKGLMAEWVGGNLAKLMNLPIADFSLVHISPELAAALPEKYIELGHGIGFGSIAAPIGSRDFLGSDLERSKDPELLAEVLVFDAWILNEDRKLGLCGGNPNALYSPESKTSLLLIDHDSAFDDNFDNKGFLRDHLAGEYGMAWVDSKLRLNWENRAALASQKLNNIWADIPEEWQIDSSGDLIQGLDRSIVESILDRPSKDAEAFWKNITQR